MQPLHVVFGAGQVGFPLAQALLAQGHRVRVVRRGAGEVPAGAEVLRGDAFDRSFCLEAAAGAAVVYHCLNTAYSAKAWARELPVLQDNLIAAAGRAGARLVVFENLYMHGRPEGVLNDDSPVRPLSRKGELRAALSAALFDAHRAGTVRVVSGRSPHLFGPLVSQSQVGEHLFTRVLAGKSAQVMGDPSRRHSFAYAPDVGRALAALGTAGDEVCGRSHVLPVVTTSSAAEFYQALFAQLGVSPRLEPTSRLMLRLVGVFAPPLREMVEMQYEWEQDYVVDDAAFLARFRFVPTPLDVALAETARWAKATYAQARAA